MFKKITSLKRIKKKTEVYNFDVPDYETYIANNFVVHNCQNFKVSQQVGEGKYHSPQDLVDLALDREVKGIVFTYNEPTIHHEYIEEVGHIIQSKELPLKLVLKSSGYANKAILRTLCLYVDAINIDIKGDDVDYEQTCGMSSSIPMLDSIELVSSMGTHLEISYMVLPSKIYDIDFNLETRDWLASIDRNIPLHLLYFYPFHKMNEKSYNPSELLRLQRLFSEKLNYVYISNRHDGELSKFRNTFCSLCGSKIIDRSSPVVCKISCCKKDISGIF